MQKKYKEKIFLSGIVKWILDQILSALSFKTSYFSRKKKVQPKFFNWTKWSKFLHTKTTYIKQIWNDLKKNLTLFQRKIT